MTTPRFTDQATVIPPGNNALSRKEFASAEDIESRNETAATAIAAQSKAMVESRYVMALRRPRNWDQVRQDIIKECRRPSFAHNKSAIYRKPIGAGVEGLGIRFVEVALRCMTNVLCQSEMLYADHDREIHRVSVTDLENNTTWPMDVPVSRNVERAKPLEDGSYISKRTNSYGKITYTVPATDDDMLNKRLALISKAMRTAGLRIIPGDLQDEAEEIIRSIRLDAAAKDPGAERKRIADAFAELGVKAMDLQEYLGHPLDTCTPPELVALRGLYGALKDGEATWKTVMDNKADQQSGGGKEPQTGSQSAPTPVFKTTAPRKAKPAPEAAPVPPPATPPEPQPPAESVPQLSPQEALTGFMSAANVSFDDFRSWLQGSGRVPDADSLASFDDVPSLVCEALAKDTKALAKCVQIYGKKE